MTAQETLDFFAKQINRTSRGLAVALASDNYPLACLNYRQQFKCYLMGGLISWRLQRDPTEYLYNAIAVVTDGSSVLSSLSASPNAPTGLPIGKAALLCELVGVEFKKGEEASEDLPLDSQLDILLAASSSNLATESRLIAQLGQAELTSLAAESYQNYFSILSSIRDFERLEELTKEGERLFSGRAKDAFFIGGEQTEGGGPDNSLVVDYRLAVALKRAGMQPGSLHSWRW